MFDLPGLKAQTPTHFIFGPTPSLDFVTFSGADGGFKPSSFGKFEPKNE